MLENSSHVPCTFNPPPVQFTCPVEIGSKTITLKKKRRPAGTPDPDAEVISLSPKTLLESDQYVCEICNQGFQRDQNLQMHRRRHKVPWKLLKRESSSGNPAAVKKRVFVCPEPSCLHHSPSHALGDLVGIKKHYRRKHSNHKQWVCAKCSKGYAVQSDYKAHLKTCGTRGHSCDCGRVFSRVENFIEHQDTCNMGQLIRQEMPALQPACLSRTLSCCRSPSNETNFSTALPSPSPPCYLNIFQHPIESVFLPSPTTAMDSSSSNNIIWNNNINGWQHHNLDLQLSSTLNNHHIGVSASMERDYDHSAQLQLSIGSTTHIGRNSTTSRERIKEQPRDQLRFAMAEKAFAEEKRQQARKQIEAAEQEFANAKRIRQQSQGELERAMAMKEQAAIRVNSTVLQITCNSCKQLKVGAPRLPPDEDSLVFSYNNMSLAPTNMEIEENEQGYKR
ncbi:hypothetical protein SAY86_025386 [Trapa natans]|uniref:C2H2-type domain-containing protein n=1 Tax=Trapa natans TaxID=22666 RepID=A0AAN7M868_TRANT|nr:hypothetical protein SAY86_025386 [Trapa natans]